MADHERTLAIPDWRFSRRTSAKLAAARFAQSRTLTAFAKALMSPATLMRSADVVERVVDAVTSHDQSMPEHIDDPHLPDRLLARYRASQFYNAAEIDFLAAKPPFISEDTGLAINAAFVRGGRSNYELVRALLDYKPPEGIDFPSRYQMAAKMARDAGNLDAVDKIVRTSPWLITSHKFYLDLAVVKGRDGIPELNKVRDAIVVREKLGGRVVEPWAELAEAHFKATGEYPQEYLLRAHTGFTHKKARGGTFTDGGVALMKAYGTCGDTQKAIDLFDRTTSSGARLGFSSTSGVVEALFHCAQQDFLGNRPGMAQTAIEKALEELGKMGSHAFSSPVALIAVRIRSLEMRMGLLIDSDPLEKFLYYTRYGENRINAIVEYARALFNLGHNPERAFDIGHHEVRILQGGNDVIFKDLFSNDYLNILETLAAAEAQFGRLHKAFELLEKMEEIHQEEPTVLTRIKLARMKAEIAAAYAKQGLRLDQIAQLTPQQRSSLWRSDDSRVREALRYYNIR